MDKKIVTLIGFLLISLKIFSAESGRLYLRGVVEPETRTIFRPDYNLQTNEFELTLLTFLNSISHPVRVKVSQKGNADQIYHVIGKGRHKKTIKDFQNKNDLPIFVTISAL